MDFTIDQHPNVIVSLPAAQHAVDAAEPVLRSLHHNPASYKATVDGWEGSYRVSFVEKHARQDGQLGNPGRRPGIQVTIDPQTFQVIRYGLIR